MSNLAPFFLLALLAAMLPLKSNAVEVLTAQELASHCDLYPEDSSSLDGEFCARYIQGFIDGAVVTDARVMLNMEADLERKETFAERAFRTRSPSRDEYMRAARYAEFCLGDPVPLAEVVNHVVADLSQRDAKETEEPARDLVYATLKKHYPCSPES